MTETIIEIISVVISAVTLLIVLINQYKMMKDKEPQLLFSLRSIDNILFLKVKNSGLTKAKNIRIIYLIKSRNDRNTWRIFIKSCFSIY